jgi:lipopolysaccharide export system permease protein
MKRWRGGALADNYLLATVLRTFLLAAAALTMLLSLLDFTDQLGAVGQGRYRLPDAFFYILLTAPLRFEEMAPIAMLLGCLLGLGALAKHSELTAMRSLGISEGRIILSLVKLAAPVIVILFLTAQFVIPSAEQAAETRHDKSLTAPASGGFWAHSGEQYLNVQGLSPDGMPQGIDIYVFTPDGALASATHAEQANVQPDGIWRLSSVTTRRITDTGYDIAHPPFLAWTPFISVKQLRRLLLPPDTMPPLALYHYLQRLRQQNQPAVRYANAFWAQISIPVAMIAMIMVAVPFVLGPPRAQSTGQQIVTGGVIGIIFSLCQQIAGYLVLLYNLDPALAELAPSLALMAFALWLLRRARKR